MRTGCADVLKHLAVINDVASAEMGILGAIFERAKVSGSEMLVSGASEGVDFLFRLVRLDNVFGTRQTQSEVVMALVPPKVIAP